MTWLEVIVGTHKVFQQYTQCFSAAYTLAQETAGFPMGSPDDLVSTAGDYLATAENEVASSLGTVVSNVTQVAGAAVAIIEVANAYNSCDP